MEIQLYQRKNKTETTRSTKPRSYGGVHGRRSIGEQAFIGTTNITRRRHVGELHAGRSVKDPIAALYFAAWGRSAVFAQELFP
jgi:hypothetical protein